MQHKSYMLRFSFTCKLKLKTPFYFIFCKFYVAARGFQKRTAFYPAKTSHNTNPAIVSITPLSGPSVANIFASLMQRDRQPPATLYSTSHMSSVEPVSRKRVRSVEGRFIKHCRNAK